MFISDQIKREDDNVGSSMIKEEKQIPLKLKKIFESKLTKIDSINVSEESPNNMFSNIKQNAIEKEEKQNLAPNIQVIDLPPEELDKGPSLNADNKGNESKEAKTILESDNQNYANTKSAHDIKRNNFMEVDSVNNPLTPENSTTSNNIISSDLIINSRKESVENNFNEAKIKEEENLYRILKTKLENSKSTLQNLKKSINEIRNLSSSYEHYLNSKFEEIKEDENDLSHKNDE